MIMMNEGITMKPVHTPQSVPPPLPLMFVWRSARAPFPSLPGDGEPASARRADGGVKHTDSSCTGVQHGRGKVALPADDIRNGMPRETEKGAVL